MAKTVLAEINRVKRPILWYNPILWYSPSFGTAYFVAAVRAPLRISEIVSDTWRSHQRRPLLQSRMHQRECTRFFSQRVRLFEFTLGR